MSTPGSSSTRAGSSRCRWKPNCSASQRRGVTGVRRSSGCSSRGGDRARSRRAGGLHGLHHRRPPARRRDESWPAVPRPPRRTAGVRLLRAAPRLPRALPRSEQHGRFSPLRLHRPPRRGGPGRNSPGDRHAPSRFGRCSSSRDTALEEVRAGGGNDPPARQGGDRSSTAQRGYSRIRLKAASSPTARRDCCPNEHPDEDFASPGVAGPRTMGSLGRRKAWAARRER